MLRWFADPDAEAWFHHGFSRRIGADVQRVAQRKLRQLPNAEVVDDRAANRRELRTGSTASGAWTQSGAVDVEFVDYHGG